MKLIGLMPVRNEEWCLGLTARAALMWCDELIIGLHACTDESKEIVKQVSREHIGMIEWCIIQDPSWSEMQHRQALLTRARENGATHIAMVDADEILCGPSLGRIRAHCDILEDHILQLPLYNLRGGIDRYHANGTWGNRIVSVALADDPALSWQGDRFHHREPFGKKLTGFQPIAQGGGGVMHLWAANLDRCRAKHRLYRVTERIRWPEKDVREIERMYSQWDKGGFREDVSKWTFNAVPDSWWKPYEDLMQYLHVDAPNWQDAECDRLIAQYGREYFKGLSV